MARLVREPDVSPFIDVLLVLIMAYAQVAGTGVIDTQLDDGLVEPDRLRDTLTIVAGRAETIRYEGRPVRVYAVDVARGAGARAIGLHR